jgi:hypothetical protein
LKTPAKNHWRLTGSACCERISWCARPDIKDRQCRRWRLPAGLANGSDFTDAMCESHCSHPRDDTRLLVENATGLPYHYPHLDIAGARLPPNLRRWAAGQRASIT